MALATRSVPSDFADRQQKYFSRELLRALTYNLKLGQYGVAKELPANSAADTIRFFRPQRAKKGTATEGPRALVEGTAPAVSSAANVGYVDIKLAQRGDLKEISDIVRGVDLFDTLAINTKLMGAEAALDFDFVCSHAICSKAGTADADGTANPTPTGQTTMYNSNTSYERFAGVVNTGNSLNDFNSLSGLSNSNAKLTRAVHVGAITRLKGVGGKPGVPPINGKYPVLCPPEVLGDMRQDSTWMAAAVFNNVKQIQLWPWAEFELDGGVFVEHNSPFIEQSGGYGIYNPSTTLSDNIYSVLYLGDQAFGVPKLSGMRAGSDPRAPSLIILDKADKADPLNQVTTLGWKAFYQAGLLWTNEATDVPHLVVQRCKSVFV